MPCHEMSARMGKSGIRIGFGGKAGKKETIGKT
jgi:hypothetical protein